MQQLLFSGIQPTGSIHLGNYLGAIRNWATLSKSYQQNIFCIVDLHATTVQPKQEQFQQKIFDAAAMLMACGITKNNNCKLYCQSSLGAHHCELNWILNCTTPFAWLNKMVQFKEKGKKNPQHVSVGLHNYPILQCADILLYSNREFEAHVPIGEDQIQHLELSRDVAQSFNQKMETPFFNSPKYVIQTHGQRIMSLNDATKKMSKSDPSEYSRISLLDSREQITLKIRKSVTDTQQGLSYDWEKRPNVSNLIEIYSILSNQSIETIVKEHANASMSELKQLLTQVLIQHLEPIQEQYHQLVQQPHLVHDYLQHSAQECNTQFAAPAMQIIKQQIMKYY